MKPLAIDLFCGLGGWTEGLLAEGYEVVGFDLERHEYAYHRYPAQLVLQDVRTLHGSQFRNADLIVASPPCHEFSYMAMPWTRAKKIAEEYRDGTRDRAKLTELFDACFRIQREACEAAGRHIPMVVENVRGAIPWVGRSRWNYGSFHLWGDVPALMPMTKRCAILKPQPYERRHGTGSWFAIDMKSSRAGIADPAAIKPPGTRFDGSGKSWQSEAVKVAGLNWNDRTRKDQAFNTTAPARLRDEIKNTGGSWFAIANNTTSGHGRNPDGRKDGVARKAASALIAKIPLPLAQHIARVYHPQRVAA